MRLDPLGSPPDFDASVDVLSAGEVDLIEFHRGPAGGRWTRQAVGPAHRLRLVLLAPSPGGAGCWHDQQVCLDRGGVALLGRTEGWWRTPNGLRGMRVNLPSAAFDLSEAELHRMDNPALLRHDPVLAGLIRPPLVGVRAHLADPRLTPDTVAAALHMSRRSLYACLPGVAATIRQARLTTVNCSGRPNPPGR